MSKVAAFILGGVATMSASSAVQAADFGATAPADSNQAASAFDGVYLGVHAGYSAAVMDSSVSYYADSYLTGFGGGADYSNDLSGFAIGGQAGGNFVLDNGLVIGGEVSADWEAVQGTAEAYDGLNAGCGPGDCLVLTHLNSATIDTVANARVKLGLVTGDLMLYATAGVAMAKLNWNEIVSIADDPSITLTDTVTDIRQGWTVGVGAEALLTDNMGVVFNYDYADYGTLDEATLGNLNFIFDMDAEFDTSRSLIQQTATVGLNYHLN